MSKRPPPSASACRRTVAIQGALDPMLLRAGGPALDARVETLLEQWSGGPYVFNLGHGVFPDTPIENIARVVKRVTDREPKVAVVLFNLGGPDGPAAVKPFLYNLFSDPAIIDAPGLLRRPLAAFIASTREKSAHRQLCDNGWRIADRGADRRTGGGARSGARGATAGRRAQGVRRHAVLGATASESPRRYGPTAPDEIVLAPLYPQYSTTTTASSITEWRSLSRALQEICCWYLNPGLIEPTPC